jgi:autotransporter-associated beta strand protein
VGGVISGNFGLTKAGAGTLSAASNWTTGSITGSADNGSAVVFTVAPAGLTAGVQYWVVGSNGTTFQVSLTPGGTAVNPTNTGTTATYTFPGTLTLGGANTFTGGVTLNAGTLNINNSGNSATNSALGTGLFTIGGVSTIDNTSGSAVALSTSTNNPQTWNTTGFTFTGSNNLDLGTGAVTLSQAPTITVSANTLTVGGPISGNFALTKAGAGTLTLGGASTYAGTTTVNAGTLNIIGTGSLNASAAKLNINPTTGNNGVVNYTSSGTSVLNAITGATVAGTASAFNQTNGLITITPGTGTGTQSVAGAV